MKTTMPTRIATKPSCTTRRGDAFGNNFGMPTAASSSVIDSGSSRTPVAIAERPSATDRNNGTAKNSPACRRYWKKNDDQPTAQLLDPRASPDRRAVRLPVSMRRRSHARKPHSTTPPPRIIQTTGERPNQSGCARLRGASSPHSPDFSTPSTIRARLGADSTVPTRSRRGRGRCRVRVGHAPRERQDRERRRSPRPRTPSATTRTS